MNEVRTIDAQVAPDVYARLPRNPVHIVLDNLRSAFNVGAVFRTADAMRVEMIHLCGYTAYPPHAKLEKTAMGTIPFVPWTHYERTEDALEKLKENGITVYALETVNNSSSLYNITLPKPVAFVFGNEALGVSENILRLCNGILEIPLYGFKNSINVATACGIVLFEASRQFSGSIEPISVFRRQIMEKH